MDGLTIMDVEKNCVDSFEDKTGSINSYKGRVKKKWDLSLRGGGLPIWALFPIFFI